VGATTFNLLDAVPSMLVLVSALMWAVRGNVLSRSAVRRLATELPGGALGSIPAVRSTT
jgi:hypothetical protein